MQGDKIRILEVINNLRKIKKDFASMKQEKHAIKSIFQRPCKLKI